MELSRGLAGETIGRRNQSCGENQLLRGCSFAKLSLVSRLFGWRQGSLPSSTSRITSGGRRQSGVTEFLNRQRSCIAQAASGRWSEVAPALRRKRPSGSGRVASIGQGRDCRTESGSPAQRKRCNSASSTAWEALAADDIVPWILTDDGGRSADGGAAAESTPRGSGQTRSRSAASFLHADFVSLFVSSSKARASPSGGNASAGSTSTRGAAEDFSPWILTPGGRPRPSNVKAPQGPSSGTDLCSGGRARNAGRTSSAAAAGPATELADVATAKERAGRSDKSRSSAGDASDGLGGSSSRSGRSSTPAADASSSSFASPSGVPPSPRAHSLDVGIFQLAHPARASRGAEDAHLIEGAWVGLADGITGWAEQGVNSGLYSQELMWNCVESIRGSGIFSDSDSDADVQGNGVSERRSRRKGGKAAQRRQGEARTPKDVLLEAHLRTELRGSCTATLASLQHGVLRAANIGDSGFLLVRQGELLAQSLPMQHGFDRPFHIGCNVGDEASCAMEYEVPVAPGDILVLGTDGLFDNLFPGEIVSIVSGAAEEGSHPETTAKRLVTGAAKRASSSETATPYSEAAKAAGRQHSGGKPDDITALVAYIQ